MKLEDAIKQALNALRATIAIADGTEQEVYAAFADHVGSEVDGWEMRLQELREEDD